ncbi:DRC10 protein, partial [Upupa epops]|nr:DRC10 protein [Upupa epops]
DKATIRLNAMKLLEPHWLKPKSTEMQRIINVLDETIAKLKMSSLIPHMINSVDRFADMLGPEVTTKLTEHLELSNEVEQLLASIEEGNTERADKQWGYLCLLEQRLKSSVLNVLRLFLAKPSLCQALKYEARTRGSPAEEFIKAFGEFRNFMLERLLTSTMEEKEKIQLMYNVFLQIQENTKAIATLDTELAAVIQTWKEEIQKKDNVIKALETSMQDMSEDCKASIQRIKEEGENRCKELLRASQASLVGCSGQLQQDLQQLEAQLSALVLEHRESELALRKRKCRLETEIVNWIQKYDTDMAEKQAEYEEVCIAYTEEKAQLSLLTEKHAVLLQEYSQIEEKHRIQALKKLATMTRAAILIQAFWRGYLVRSHFKTKMKKKGK